VLAGVGAPLPETLAVDALAVAARDCERHTSVLIAIPVLGHLVVPARHPPIDGLLPRLAYVGHREPDRGEDVDGRAGLAPLAPHDNGLPSAAADAQRGNTIVVCRALGLGSARTGLGDLESVLAQSSQDSRVWFVAHRGVTFRMYSRDGLQPDDRTDDAS
jgi:hypothetical protein